MSCPCGVGKEYSSCCEPLHKGTLKAETAEQLMLSRYCAFAKQEIDYVINTQDSASRGELNRNEIEIWSKESEWKNIDVISTEAGLKADEEGMVEFKATYIVGDKEVVHHEKSTFKKEDGDWFFVEGDVLRDQVKRAGPKVGRNDPCPCGSGKKFKKCCNN